VLHFRDPAETGRKRQILPRRSHCTWIHLGAEQRGAITASARHRHPVPAQPPPGDLAQRPVLEGHARAGDAGFWRQSTLTR
jgi:hypothetical protein